MKVLLRSVSGICLLGIASMLTAASGNPPVSGDPRSYQSAVSNPPSSSTSEGDRERDPNPGASASAPLSSASAENPEPPSNRASDTDSVSGRPLVASPAPQTATGTGAVGSGSSTAARPAPTPSGGGTNPSTTGSEVATKSLSPASKPVLPANPPPPVAKASDACDQDIPRFCPHLPWGEGLSTCLEKKLGSLSPDCRSSVTALSQRHDRFKQVRRTCRKDANRLCKGVQPGKGRVLGCLKAKETQASQTCKAELKGLGTSSTG